MSIQKTLRDCKDLKDQGGNLEGQSQTKELSQMIRDSMRPEQERGNRLEAARDDTTQAVGFTPGLFEK